MVVPTRTSSHTSITAWNKTDDDGIVLHTGSYLLMTGGYVMLGHPYGLSNLGQEDQQGPSKTQQAGEILAIIGAMIGIGKLIRGLFSGCGQTCVQATNIANQVEVLLKQNLQAFQNGPQIRSIQVQALAVFDSAWTQLVQACENPALGSAGQRCISERQRGGIAPWCPNPGHTGCDWFALYRDPIANAAVTDDSVAGSVSSLATTPGPGGLPLGLLLGGALLAVGVLS